MTQLSPQTTEFLRSETGQMFLGLLLGDGSISKGRFEHIQTGLYWEYTKWISLQFQNNYPELITPKIAKEFFYARERTNQQSPVIYISQTFYTKVHSIFIELYEVFYPNGTKIIPMEIIQEYFTEISLLFLYLDDGKVARRSYTGLSLCLCNFPDNQLKEFQMFLMEKWEYKTSLHKDRQYLLIYFPMESTNKLLNRFNEMTDIINFIGIIAPTKLQKKTILVSKSIIEIKTDQQDYILTDKTQIDNQLKGLLQGYIVGGSNLRWNPDSQNGYLRLRLNTEPTPWIYNTLQRNNYKVTDAAENIHIGIELRDNTLVKDVINAEGAVMDLSQSLCVQNPSFWKTLFLYKGRDLKNQRGGLTIGLNHLPIKTVEQLSNSLNNEYSLETKLRYRDNKTKASIYIPVYNREAFYAIIDVTNIKESK